MLDGTADSVSRDQLFSASKGIGKKQFSYSADHNQNLNQYKCDGRSGALDYQQNVENDVDGKKQRGRSSGKDKKRVCKI